jgi:alkaline phosphatase
MRVGVFVGCIAWLTLSAGPASAGVLPAHQGQSEWFISAQAAIEERESAQSLPLEAKNIILFLGDGMGVSTLTSGRIFQAQQRGATEGEEHALSFERFPYSALVKTYNVDAQVPDSAGTMSAIVTGVKTDMGVFGFDETVTRGDCRTITKANELVTYLELAELQGMATGIVTTARVTHATPGALYAKTVDRNFEDNSDIPADSNCAGVQEDIASQFISFEKRLAARFPGYDTDGIDVVMGGGRRHFLPDDPAFNIEKDPERGPEGDRTDQRHLLNEWLALYDDNSTHLVVDQKEFDALDPAATKRVLALFNESHLRYEADRNRDVGGEPSLQSMTEKAIAILQRNPKGYFLMVEGARIDHAHHAGNAYNALNDVASFADAVAAAVAATDPRDTLILVTADHSHTLTIAGYPKRGNPILGKVVSSGQQAPTLAQDGMPYTSLQYANGMGFCDLGAETDADAVYDASRCSVAAGTRVDLTDVDTEAPGFHQEALVPLASGETHAGEDVALHALGAGAQRVQGVIEQSTIFHIMNAARPVVVAQGDDDA